MRWAAGILLLGTLLPLSGMADEGDRGALIDIVIAGVGEGASPSVYIDFMEKATRCRLESADMENLTVNLAGSVMPMPWGTVSDRRLYQMAKKLVAEDDVEGHLTVYRFAAARPELAAQKEKLELLMAEKFPGRLEKEKAAAEAAAEAAENTGGAADTAEDTAAPATAFATAPAVVEDVPPAMGPHRTPGPFLTAARGAYKGIYRGHPKIFVRGGGGKPATGISLGELRARAKSAPWSRYNGQLALHSAYGTFYSLPNLALKWLALGDVSAADRAISIMKGAIPRNGTTTDGDLTEAAAIAYDWLYNYEGFTEEDKKTVRGNLMDSANRLRRIMHDHVFHTRPNAWASGALMVGLAVYPEEPEGERLALEAVEHWKKNLFPARELQDGPWQNSMAYGRKYLTRSVFHAASAWASATDDDVWFEAARRGNWAERMLYTFIYACRPDYTYVTYGDFFSSFWTARTGSMCNALDAAQGTRNPYGQGFVAELEQKYGTGGLEPHRAYYFLVFYDPTIGARPKAGLPLCEMFGQHSMGCVFMRSGWGPNDLFLFFKCGDYYGDHGHFDEGTFEIFYRKALAVDSGSYTESFGGPHRMDYARRAIAHNTLVFPERGKADDEGGQRIFHQQGVGNPRALPSQCDTGDIAAFKDTAGYCHVLADVARAYDRVKVFYRHFLYVKPNVVVVFDAVSLPEKYRRVFLYHYPTKAEVSERVFRVANGGGGLAGQVLLPRAAEVRDVPGFKVGTRDLAPRNQGSPDITGKGRVEIEPAGAAGTTTYFLVVMTIGEGGSVRPAPAQVEDTGGAFQVTVGGQTFLFGKDGRSMSAK